jgi:hypothetical protein
VAEQGGGGGSLLVTGTTIAVDGGLSRAIF